jgi:hypothetical protein
MLATIVLASVTGFVNVLPVTVASCQISDPVRVPSDAGLGGFETIGAPQLHVRFSDTASEPISRIVFRLNDGTTVSDVGNFSPGVSIDHTLPLKDSNATSCAVDAVLLTDGTQISLAMHR